MTENINESSFLAALLKKKAAVLQSQQDSGKSMKPLLEEVDRQIKEVLRGKDPIKGEGVTKSGSED